MGRAYLCPFGSIWPFFFKRIVVIITDTLEMFLPLQTSSGLVQLPKPYFLNNSCTVNHGLLPKFTLVSHKNSLQFWIFFGKILPQFWIFPFRPHSAELWPRQRKTTGRSAEGKLQLRWVKVYSTVLGGTLKKFRNHFINTKEVWQKSCSTKPASAASSPSACFSFCELAPSWVKIHLVLPCKYFLFSVSRFPPESKSVQFLLANICPQGACCGCDSWTYLKI